MRQYEMNLRAETRRTLRTIAASLGCVADRGPTTGEGSITKLNEAIAGGEVVCVKSDEAAVILTALRSMRDNSPAEWDAVVTPELCNIWDALKKAQRTQPQGEGE
jgi:hypothetical protein